MEKEALGPLQEVRQVALHPPAHPFQQNTDEHILVGETDEPHILLRGGQAHGRVPNVGHEQLPGGFHQILLHGGVAHGAIVRSLKMRESSTSPISSTIVFFI